MALEFPDIFHAGFHVHVAGPGGCSLVAAKGIVLATFQRTSQGEYQFDLVEGMQPEEYQILTGAENAEDGSFGIYNVGVQPFPNDPPPGAVSSTRFQVSTTNDMGQETDIGFSVAFFRLSQGRSFDPIPLIPVP